MPTLSTLCGTPEEELKVYLCHFEPDAEHACPRCRAEAAAAPTVPCEQERLHDLVMEAAPSALRTRLLDALRTGADIGIRITGPASGIAVYTHLDRITEGGDALRPLLSGRNQTGVARVVQPAGEFVILLPQDTEPVIAWASTETPTG